MYHKNLRLLFFCLTTLSAATAQEAFPVHFEWGVENFPDNLSAAKQNFRVPAEQLVKGKLARYAHFEKTLSAAERSAVNAMDIDILDYVYPATYLLLLPESIDIQTLEKFSVRSVIPLKPEWKMAKSLREPPYGQWAVHGDWIDVNLQAFPHVSISETAAMCRENGIVVQEEGSQNGVVQVRILKDKVLEIAALPFVRFLELAPPPGEKEDTKGRSLHRSNTLDVDYPMGKKFNGAGVRTLLRDDGQLGTHIDFKGRFFHKTTTLPTVGTHGDAVGGILVGAGNLDPSKKGMAAGADMFVIDVTDDFQDQTLPLHLSEGVTITNTSYSNGCNLGYTLSAQTVDKQLYEHPTLMHVFSAGNSNNSDCGYGAGTQWGNITGGHKMSKNSIAAGNLLQDATLHSTSSRGPAYDGRIKPDICANGANQFSTGANNNYIEFGGTSGASPGIAGCMAQLTQAYKTLHSGQEPNATLLKATILNTATDLGNVGPDFKFGWGHINAWRALGLLEQNRHLAASIGQGAVNMHPLTIPANTRQARVMIVWADPPASLAAARALLNDLDITVVAPDGTTVFLPWKLNPTPDPIILDTPAGRGRDSLNNVEQVAINDPVPGVYSIRVKGTDVPFGPQSYHLVWDFLTDEVKLTYPVGGEGFVAGEVERIHWDAYGTTSNFNLGYSTDGGATFNAITSLSGDKRMYDWTVPNVLSGKVKILIVRDASRDTTDFPFTIAPVPQNIKIVKVCPDSVTVGWNEVNDSLSYDVYVLGAKYMEIVGTSDTNQYTFPISDSGMPQWVAVRTSYADGTQGRRSIAVNWPGQLKNCPQNYDLSLPKLVDPGGDAIVYCAASEQPVTVRIKNNGLSATVGGTIHYQVDNEPVVSEVQPDILPGDSMDFTFQTPFFVLNNGIVHLKIWSDFPGDVTHYNDTISLFLPAVAQAVSGVFQENFEASTNAPLGWVVTNPDGSFTWKLTNLYPELIGANGSPTRAYFMNHYQYQAYGELDNLYMIPVDFSNLAHPVLGFDLAHLQFDQTYMEGLRIEVFPNCDLSADPVVVYEKYDPELSTNGTSTTFFVPDSSNDWRREMVRLEAFAGQTAIIRFVSINDYGNNTFLDNIGIENLPLPVAAILSPMDTICRNQSTVFTADQLAPDTQYEWLFGSPAVPTSGTGPGPHSVTYPAQGSKIIRLIATNALGSDTTYYTLVVLPVPASNFTQTSNNLTVTFTNTSSNATTYLWKFGDGMTSTLQNPAHTYLSPGTYTVTLEASNQCSTASKTVNVSLTTNVNDLSAIMRIGVLPNPTEGDFIVKIESDRSEEIQLNLLDPQGRLVKSVTSRVKQGVTDIVFEGLSLPKGIYQLNLVGRSGQATISIAIQ